MIAVLPFSIEGDSEDIRNKASEIEREITATFANSGDTRMKFGPIRKDRRLSSMDLRQLSAQLGSRWIVIGDLHVPHTNSEAGYHLDALFADGLNGEIIWSNEYEYTDGRPFDPRVVSRRFLFDLGPHFLGAARTAVEEMPVAALQPKELFYLANWAWGNARPNLEWEIQRVNFARRAVAIDPAFGPAYSILADKLAYLANVDRRWASAEVAKEAKVAADKALELAPYCSQCTFNVALHYWHIGDLREMTRLLQRTLDLNPHHLLATFLLKATPYACNDAPEAVVAELEAFEKDLAPNNQARWVLLQRLSRIHFVRGEFQTSVELARRSSSIFPHPSTSMWLAAALVQIHETDEARVLLQQMQKSWPGLDVAFYIDQSLPKICANSPRLEFVKAAFRALEQATE